MNYSRRLKFMILYFTNKRKKLLFLIAVFLLILLYFKFFKKQTIPIEYVHYQALLRKNRGIKGQCKVPQLDPWDSSILSYYYKPSLLRCKAFLHNVTYLDHDGIVKITDNFKNKVDCRYRYFDRNEGLDDTDIVYDKWKSFEESELKLEKEFVEVECVKKGGIIKGVYIHQWAKIVPKELNVAKKEILDESIENPSVIMIGLDSMSRSNFIRQLPETYKVLEKQGFVELNSHVKVMDNTYGNWLAIMTGKTGTSTKEFKAELPDEWNIWFDDFDIIWKHYLNKGYSTLFAEDRPDIATFNYFGYLKGFRFKPVDHYFRPFWLSCYWSLVFRRSTTGCYDSIPLHKIQFDYLQDYLKEYQSKRKFTWWWTQDLSHDHLNQIGVIDNDFAQFLINNEKYMENSIVIIFSDHGHRYDNIRETIIGRLEARLPFLSIKIPKKLNDAHPWIKRNLEYNRQLMTTQYDLHQTLIHIADDGFLKSRDILIPTQTQRAFSLFRKVYDHRTCYEAHVPEDYCPCYQEVDISLTEAIKPAQVLLEYANKLINDYNSVNSALDDLHIENVGDILDGNIDMEKTRYKCAELKLDEIQYASVKLPPPRLVQDPQVQNEVVSNGIELSYRITLKCQAPSNAIIEGVVRHQIDSGKWEPLGEIERNNKYGNTSSCVADRLLKKICYCIKVD